MTDKISYSMTNLPQGWEKFNFDNIFYSPSSKNYQLNTKDYLEKGCIPIIDQSKKFIIGYSNDYEKVFKINNCNNSCIIFGDHTRVLKFIDFDFIVGADGVKILLNKDIERFNTKFLFFQLLYKDIPLLGYRRHFSVLKQSTFSIPPLKEQGRIAGILDLAFEKIDKSVELLKANLANLDELAQSVLDRAFNPLGDSVDSTESTQNPSTHDTQSPYPLPQHWEWKSLGEMCKILNGGTPDTKNPVFWDLHQSHEVQTDKSVVGVGGEVERGEGATSQFKPLHPLAKEKSYYWATLVDTKQKYLHSTQRKITQKGLDSSNATLLPVNSVIFSSRASIGEVCIAKVETATNQGYKNFVCDENVLYYEFLYFALQRFAKEIESLAQGTTYKEVSKAKISEFQIPLPKDIKEQEQIAMHLDSVFDKIQKLKELYNAQLQDYEELKQSLLTQAFSGKL